MRLEIKAPGYRWIAETDRSVSDASWTQIVPLTMRAVQTEWSGDVMELFDGAQLAIGPAAEPVPFQYPGLLVYDPRSGRFAMCFGEGRWQDGFGPLPAVPVAHVVAGLDRLQEFGRSLQFVGAQELTISRADETSSEAQPLLDEAGAEGRLLEIGLGDVVARGVLLERTSPDTAGALGNLLPLQGRATNTYASGPLTRFWNDAGGREGATMLENIGEAGQPSNDHRGTIAAPGYIYYMSSPPWNGLRISARHATVMKGALPGGNQTRLVPVVKLVADWHAFREVAANLRFTGARPMFIRVSE